MRRSTYRGASFDIASRKNFWKECGKFDSIIEFQECAHSDFKASYVDAYTKEGISKSDYINRKANELGIFLGYFNVPNYEDTLYGCYLILPMSCFDSFLDEFIKDLSMLGFKKTTLIRNSNRKNSNKTKFIRVQKILKTNGVIVNFEPWNIDVFEYFRLRRNAIAHGLDSSHYMPALVKASTWVSTIQSRYPKFKNILDVNGALTFDDFLLCTTNVKNIGDLMTIALEGKINWRKVGKNRPHYINYKLMNGMDKACKLDYIRKCVLNMYSISLTDIQCSYFL